MLMICRRARLPRPFLLNTARRRATLVLPLYVIDDIMRARQDMRASRLSMVSGRLLRVTAFL